MRNWPLAFAVLLVDQLAIHFWGLAHAVDTGRWFPVSPLLTAGVAFCLLWIALPTVPHRSWWLVLGATLSNLITFLAYGRVIDYIPFGPWFTNGADMVIIVGLLWLYFVLLTQKKETP